MLALPPALAPLAQRDQFVCWFAVPVPDKPGKMNKFPCRWDTGVVIDAQDPANWTNAATALAMASQWDRGHGGGAGYVFTDADPYAFLDIDKCLEPSETGGAADWSQLAKELLARLPGAAVEVSQSGQALHVFGRYSRVPEHAKKNTPLGLELYTGGRFCALTGTHAMGSVDTDITASLELIVAQYFVPSATGDFAGWTSEPVAEWSGPTDDEDLLAKAMKSGKRSAAAMFGDGGHVTFEDLWTANADKLAGTWPGEGHKPFGQSEADLALADHLAYWTGKNCERIEALMRRSALARDKWDSHRTYLAGTILKACAFTRTVAQARVEPAPVLVEPPTPEAVQAAATAGERQLRGGTEYMGAVEQVNHFAGCYYVTELGAVFSLPKNGILTRPQFDVLYGGYLFTIDPMQQKSTASAWEAFTLSRAWAPPVVDDMCFRPETTPGSVIMVGGRSLVNGYVPFYCECLDGDPAPFLNFLAKLLPDAEDRRILLNYLASMAQNPGNKFQWWPVLQGVEGNGKTMIGTVMSYIMGEHYTHLPNAHAMAKNGIQFNSWINRKLLIIVEEIALAGKRDFLDEFKTVVTNLRIPLEGKGTNQVTGDNRANGLLFTNHKDGVPVTADQRRYAIFYTAQQRFEDLVRDGMDGAYFPDLWDWYFGREAYAGQAPGAAVIAGYLKTFAVEVAYDPARLSKRAPKTSSSRAAVENSFGTAEQEIREAIEEGRQGFAGGWVSSTYLDRMIDALRLRIPRNRRRDMMIDLGYDWHPCLRDGRTNDTVNPDNSKPKLYLKTGHLALNITSPADIAKAYSKAQEAGVDHGALEAARVFNLTPPS